MLRTHLLGPVGLHRVREVGCGGSRGSMKSQPDERRWWLSSRKTSGAQGKRPAGRKKFSLPYQAFSLLLTTQTRPANLNHLRWLHLLYRGNDYKEKCTANLSLELSRTPLPPPPPLPAPGKKTTNQVKMMQIKPLKSFIYTKLLLKKKMLLSKPYIEPLTPGRLFDRDNHLQLTYNYLLWTKSTLIMYHQMDWTEIQIF